MSKKIYVDAVHPEETRVVVVDTATNRVADFDVETTTKPQIKGNIYLAKVIRVEPSLQAAFVDYGTGKNGFLPFSEIHPDYYQVSAEQKKKLLELMQEKTFDELSVTELCSYLSLSRRSFYRYFRDLEDVLDSALNHVFQKMAMPESFPDLGEIQRTYEFWKENRAVLDALHHSDMTDRLFEYVVRYTSAMKPPEAAVDQGFQEEVRLFATAGSIALILNWHKSGFSKSPEEMSRKVCRMLYEPLLNEKYR